VQPLEDIDVIMPETKTKKSQLDMPVTAQIDFHRINENSLSQLSHRSNQSKKSARSARSMRGSSLQKIKKVEKPKKVNAWETFEVN
jgi:hypothetical protein